MDLNKFEEELTSLVNKEGLDSYMNMEDYVVAKYLVFCIKHLHGIHESFSETEFEVEQT